MSKAIPPLGAETNSDKILHSGESLKLSGEKVVDGDRINCDNNNLVIESDCECVLLNQFYYYLQYLHYLHYKKE